MLKLKQDTVLILEVLKPQLNTILQPKNGSLTHQRLPLLSIGLDNYLFSLTMLLCLPRLWSKEKIMESILS